MAAKDDAALQKQAEEQGEVVRKIKEAIKADPNSYSKDDLNKAVALLKELKAKADDPMNALEDPIIKGKYELVRSVGEECVTDGELAMLLSKKPDSFVLYDGFEPSGRMHIAQGVFKAMNVNKCTRGGGTFIFWVADWFALMNDKMGGDLHKIKVVGKYLVEVWKATGMDMDKVKFIWSSDEITNNAAAYWTQALDVARRTTVARVKKCCQIMGRLENKLTAAQILYPLMQCTDIFFLKADICQLGVDQRKVNMLAREYCDSAGIKNKPIILSHHMLYGLKKGQEKMSKSDPDSAIFMEDTPEDVQRKINNAYCPSKPEEEEGKAEAAAGEAEGELDAGLESMHLSHDALKNPCLDYVQHIIFSVPDATFEAGGKKYASFTEVEADFLAGALTEEGLKAALITAVNLLLDPVRKHFSTDDNAKAILAQVMEWKRENLVPDKSLKRLAVTDGSKAVWAVFAPPASPELSLGSLVSVLKQLEAAPADSEVVLWCGDWSSFALNRCGGDHKVIRACYDLLVVALKATAPALMARVKVLVQSEQILVDPSLYWISVINVGRTFQLQKIRDVDESNEYAGQVVASLMHVGDVLALAPTVICCSPADKKLHEMAVSYYGECGITEIATPTVNEAEAVDSLLKPPHMLEGPVNADDNVFILDGTMDVGRKMKRAFCEPANIEHCPPITLANAVAFRAGASIAISRKPENGGDKEYTSVAEMEGDFKSGALHPGDLKPCVTKAVDAFIQQVRDVCKSDAAAKKAEADVKAYLKKVAASNKKK
eukprot:CAMPEP_0181304206 /NCGR_PEP_ID=MMETSP1101-20121128/9016_1 /TAXON_ID=46948 /ORGANISM="Rhodomonas abbreviata, Strain Caron Lab Isolate" /LENGTH=773 /DNA_ID=CAMNT_0023409927 /DNA_START=263 /DNA_END=2585 /DNA_ORIENTATION=+